MNATPPEVQVTLYLPDHEALALTQFAKRIGWVETLPLNGCASNE